MAAREPARASTEWLLITLLLLGVILMVTYLNWLWRWDQLLYDTQYKFWSRPLSQDIVIVAVDERSLSGLGRWPWSRRIHASLVRKLTEAGARVVALDFIFAEQDEQDPEGDRQLADAVRANGRVVLPVAIEQMRLGGGLVETLPIAALADAAAQLGHVHIELDPDGIARRLYLRQGLGSPHWPNLSVALSRVLDPGDRKGLPGSPTAHPTPRSGEFIVSDHQILIPYAGPPGSYPRIPYIDLLNGNLPRDALRDKIVLVGVTAAGLGDSLPTPVSGLSQPMPGVEINATVIDALRQGITILEMELPWRMALSGLLLILPLSLFPRISPRSALAVIVIMLLLTVLLCSLLLHAAHVWYPPAPLLLGLVMSYPIWSWRRLERTLLYFEQELERLRAEPEAIAFYRDSDQVPQGLQFVQQIVPLQGWTLRDQAGNNLEQWGTAPDEPQKRPSENRWALGDGGDWTAINRGQGRLEIGIRWATGDQAQAAARLILSEVFRQLAKPAAPPPRSTTELIENQIHNVQTAVSQLRSVREFISDTLDQMIDGLMVVNAFGQVVLANRQAGRFLGLAADGSLTGESILQLAARVQTQEPGTWARALGSVLLELDPVSFEGRQTDAGELLVQVSPLSLAGPSLRGAIVILSDISLLKESERKRAQALSFLSHDLRSPLTSLLSLVELYRARPSRFTLEEMTDRTSLYAKSALKLSEDFLQLARAENIDQTEFQEVDFVAIASNALDDAFTMARERQIRLARHIEADEAWLRADPGLLERALINLLENAIRYSPPGSSVELSLVIPNDHIRCCIRDQGPGIAEEDQTRIFEPFRRGSNVHHKHQTGTGLGLALVKVAAEKHRGSVGIESRPGRGARFCLRLPLQGGDCADPHGCG